MKKEKLVICTEQELANIIEEQLKLALKNNSKNQKTDFKPKDELIPRIDLARKLKVSTVTLDKWVKLNIIPEPIKIGGRIYFNQEQVWKTINRSSKQI